MRANCVPDVYLLPLETDLNPALIVYHQVLEKIGNFTATESLGSDPGADMPFFLSFYLLRVLTAASNRRCSYLEN